MLQKKGIQKLIWSFGFLYFVLEASSGAHASIAQTYGLGSRAASLMNAGASSGFGAFAASYNPAFLPLGDQKERLHFEYGLLFMNPQFDPIQNVVIENEYSSDTPDDLPISGDVDTDYRATTGQALGLSYVLSENSFRPTVGISAYLPLDPLAYLDTGEPFIPEFALYRSRNQRPQVEFALGGVLNSRTSIGLGLRMAYTLTANANAFLLAGDNQSSRMRLNASLKPKLGPYAGVRYQLSPALTLGAVIRAPLTSTSEITVRSGAKVVGVVPGIDVEFLAYSALYYDPGTVELGASYELDSPVLKRILAQVDFQAWNLYVPPAIRQEQPNVEDCLDTGGGACSGLILSPSRNPHYDFQNIFVPRLGVEFKVKKTQLRLGYGYNPSILKEVPSGAGNLLDPPKHMLSLGAGWTFPRFLHFQHPWHLHAHVAYQSLVTQKVEKASGDEAGNGTGPLKIGAPGYSAGGKIWGGGLSLSLEI